MMNHSKLFLFGALLALSLNAQQQPKPPQPTIPQPRVIPAANDYGQAVAILKGGSTDATPKTAQKPAPRKSWKRNGPDIEGSIDTKPLEVWREVPIPANAQFGLSLSKDWLANGPVPIASPDSRVLYTYGQGVPTVVCAILQVCEMDLQPGEQPMKDSLDWGDHRFAVATRAAGTGDKQFSYLIFKPTMPGLDTTLTVGTSKRAYYVRLISTGEAHMTRVGFVYPEEAAEQRRLAEEARKAEDKRKAEEAAKLVQLNTQKPIRNRNFTVKLHGKDAHYLRPEAVGDDGVHTYITLPEQARHRGLPVVQLSDARGAIPANARWDDDRLIVDAVFERACLLEGVGKKQQRACITNHALRSAGGNK